MFDWPLLVHRGLSFDTFYPKVLFWLWRGRGGLSKKKTWFISEQQVTP